MQETALLICAYLLGSVPTGLLLARSMGVNIRETGSGNIGATNVYRTMGRKVGILTLIGDCLKGLIPVLVWLVQGGPELIVMSLAIAALVIFRHHENIARLRAGTESKFKA